MGWPIVLSPSQCFNLRPATALPPNSWSTGLAPSSGLWSLWWGSSWPQHGNPHVVMAFLCIHQPPGDCI